MNQKLLFNFIEQVLATAQAGMTLSKDDFDSAWYQSIFVMTGKEREY